MDSKRQNKLDLFKQITGKSMIKVPVLSEPKMQYFGSRVERYFK